MPTLTAAVNNPWWRETTLLFVSGSTSADADPIVQACLDTGTAAALALAFDCADLSGNLAPELRRRLEGHMSAAFEPGAPAAHVELIAGVLAHRLRGHQVTSASGTRVGVRPVGGALFRLFLDRTGRARPVGSVLGDGPATGLSASHAARLAGWLGEVTDEVYALPTAEDLKDPGVRDAIRRAGAPAVHAVWLADGARCALVADASSTVSAAQLRAAVRADVSEWSVAELVMLAVARVVRTAGPAGETEDRRLLRKLQTIGRLEHSGRYRLDSRIGRVLGLDVEIPAAADPGRKGPDGSDDLDAALIRQLGRSLAQVRRLPWPPDLVALLTATLPADWVFEARGSAFEEFRGAFADIDGRVATGGAVSWRETVYRRMYRRIRAIVNGDRELTAADATAVRLAALVLAGEPDVDPRPLWRLAAAVTMLQRQVEGVEPATDGIVLAFG